jgi:hypothetical protein
MQSTSDGAVVIGASMAGLLAARVLADRFDQVTVLDRDDLPDGADSRKGVPLHGDNAPADDAGYLAFAESLPTDEVGGAVFPRSREDTAGHRAYAGSAVRLGCQVAGNAEVGWCGDRGCGRGWRSPMFW